jgi:hypothetical protein
MEFLRMIVVYLSIYSVTSKVLPIESKESLAATAISEIIESFQVEHSMNFDFIVYKSSLDDLAKEIAKAVKKTTKIIEIANLSTPMPIYQSAILFFYNEKNFREFYEKAHLANEFSTHYYFVVYIANFRIEDFKFFMNVEKIQELFLFLYFLCDSDDGNHFELVTFTLFNQPKCRQEQKVVINRFSKDSKKWESQKFAIEKFRNFNGCDLVVHRPETSKYLDVYNFIAPTLNITTIWTFQFGEDIVSDIPRSQVVKFDLNYIPIPSRLISQFSIMEIRFAATHCITFSDQTMIVSRSAPYTMAEKALMPLDNEVWYWLIGFVVFGVVVIIVVSFMRRSVKDLVIGLGVKTPLLNLM